MLNFLRDPIWQSIAVFVTVFFGILELALPRLKKYFSKPLTTPQQHSKESTNQSQPNKIQFELPQPPIIFPHHIEVVSEAIPFANETVTKKPDEINKTATFTPPKLLRLKLLALLTLFSGIMGTLIGVAKYYFLFLIAEKYGRPIIENLNLLQLFGGGAWIGFLLGFGMMVLLRGDFLPEWEKGKKNIGNAWGWMKGQVNLCLAIGISASVGWAIYSDGINHTNLSCIYVLLIGTMFVSFALTCLKYFLPSFDNEDVIETAGYKISSKIIGSAFIGFSSIVIFMSNNHDYLPETQGNDLFYQGICLAIGIAILIHLATKSPKEDYVVLRI